MAASILSMSKEEIDYYYSPSQFSSRPSSTTVDIHVNNLNKATLNARKVVKCDIGVQYLSSGQLIDIYYPASGVNDGTVIFLYIHGGYWQALSLDESGFMAFPLTTNNIILAAVGYDIAPIANMTSIVEQCKEACAFLSRKFPKNKLYIGGHSAGGHLAALMLSTDWSKYNLLNFPISGVILMSGIYDLGPIQKSYVNDPLQLTDVEVKELSPIGIDLVDHIPNQFPCLIAEGELESPEFKRQGLEYCNILTSADAKLTFKEMKGEDHFTLIEKLDNEEYELTKIIINFLHQRN